MFKGLSEEQILSIYSLLGDALKIAKGNELYRSGTIGIIKSGTATIKRLNDNGDSITIRTMSSGELFGAASVFGNWKDGMSSIIAKEDCLVLYISEQCFTKLIKQYPQISLNYIEYLSDKIRFLNRKLDAFTAKSTEQRLYEFLLSQSNEDGLVNLGFGMAELSRRLSVGRTSLYRDISSLESKKLLTRDGHNFKINK